MIGMQTEAIESPDQHVIDLRRRAASNSVSRASRWAAPEPTSLTCMAMVQPRLAAYSRIRTVLHG
jgi:hypothetical protein